MKKQFILWALCTTAVLAVLFFIKQTSVQPPSGTINQTQHTTAVNIELDGCGNLYKVSDTLYRGAQPTNEGFKELEKLGIKTVVNLRSLHSDRDELEGTKLAYEHIPMEAWDPELDEVEAFLKIVTNPENQPVFVHCQHGADRTGTMTAIYRIVVEGWDKNKAIDEMQNGPFGFHEIFSGLPEFIETLDVEKLRKEYAAE